MPYNLKNPISLEKRRKYDREYKAKIRKTPEGHQKSLEIQKKWRDGHLEQHRAHSSRYQKEHRSELNAKLRERYKNDPVWRIQCLLRSRMKDYWNNSSIISNSAYRDFLGCSLDDLKKRLESQFKPGMTWDNQGRGWHIDHIIPLSLFTRLRREGTEELFDLYLEDAFNYTNLRPEWGKENEIRGNRWIFAYSK